MAIGPVLGGLLLTHFWWGSVFLINVPVTVAGVVASLILVPESRNPAPGKIDYVGVLASIIGLVLLVYGIVQGGDGESWGSLGVLGPTLGGLVVLALFAWYESRIEHPSLDVRLFKNRSLRPPSARSRCCSSAWAASTSSPASTCRTSAATARLRPACSRCRSRSASS